MPVGRSLARRAPDGCGHAPSARSQSRRSAEDLQVSPPIQFRRQSPPPNFDSPAGFRMRLRRVPEAFIPRNFQLPNFFDPQ
jgi:hypothetical protein